MSDQDSNLFKQEVAGVVPLKQEKVEDIKSKPVPSEAQLKSREAAIQSQKKEANGLTLDEVEPVGPHDIIGFKLDGIQDGVYKKLRLGKYDIHAVLDLHRRTLKQARQAVFEFVRESVDHDLRTVMILHGKGEFSDPPALLKSYVNCWLPGMHEVLAFHSATKHQGGAGAVVVLLRKSGKKHESRERHHGR